MALVLEALTTNYANFRGRARRREFWLFHVSVFAGIWILTFVTGWAMLAIRGGEAGSALAIGVASVVYVGLLLASVIPTIAVTVRRMHDVGKTGWVSVIPFYNLIAACLDSQPGPNRYGPNPKRAADV